MFMVAEAGIDESFVQKAERCTSCINGWLRTVLQMAINWFVSIATLQRLNVGNVLMNVRKW